MRLIDADRLLSDRMKKMYYHLPNGDTAIPLIDIEHAPTIEERKKGKWIHHKPFDCEHHNCNTCIECSCCGTWFGADSYAQTNYCPNCGAYMKGEYDENQNS